MSTTVSRFSLTATETPAPLNILVVRQVTEHEVILTWTIPPALPPGTFSIVRKPSAVVGKYEFRGFTRGTSFTDYVDAPDWYKYRLLFTPD